MKIHKNNSNLIKMTNIPLGCLHANVKNPHKKLKFFVLLFNIEKNKEEEIVLSTLGYFGLSGISQNDLKWTQWSHKTPSHCKGQ